MRVGVEVKFEYFFIELRMLSKLEWYKCEYYCKFKGFMIKIIIFASVLKLCKFVIDIDDNFFYWCFV